MKRYLILLGDKTTAGGVVIQGTEGGTHHGTPFAIAGAKIYCRACQSEGVICNVEPYRPMRFDGMQVALENDICICKCNPPPRLIASQRNSSMSFDAEELASKGFHPDGRPLPKDTGKFDEQVRAIGGGASEGYPYFIITANGRTMQGRLDTSGILPRIYTASADHYDVYWGDEALAKQHGI